MDEWRLYGNYVTAQPRVQAAVISPEAIGVVEQTLRQPTDSQAVYRAHL
jgi:hypothetical protein